MIEDPYISRQTDALTTHFSDCLAAFENSHIFSGPSVYFHQKTIALRKKHKRADKAIDDPVFMESLYATLTAWDMHHLGNTHARLVEYGPFCASFQRMKEDIQYMDQFNMPELTMGDGPFLPQFFWEIISELEVSVGAAKLIGGPKALHHLIPNVLPPIDREYTLRFLLNSSRVKRDGREELNKIWPYLVTINFQNTNKIKRALSRGGFMNTSYSKVIDNAIVGARLLCIGEPVSVHVSSQS